ncbi:MAG: hypothetical protein ABI977_05770 [Acidobacteriota bacterium]
MLETVTARYGLVVIPGGIMPDFSEKEKAVKKEFSLASFVVRRSIFIQALSCFIFRSFDSAWQGFTSVNERSIAQPCRLQSAARW